MYTSSTPYLPLHVPHANRLHLRQATAAINADDQRREVRGSALDRLLITSACLLEEEATSGRKVWSKSGGPSRQSLLDPPSRCSLLAVAHLRVRSRFVAAASLALHVVHRIEEKIRVGGQPVGLAATVKKLTVSSRRVLFRKILQRRLDSSSTATNVPGCANGFPLQQGFSSSR